MTNLRKAAEMALEALEAITEEMTFGERYTNAGQYLVDSLPALRSALAEQEPVAYQYQSTDGEWYDFFDEFHYHLTVENGRWPVRALYTHPATPLTDEQISRAWEGGDHNASAATKRRITRAIEAELGVKK